MFPYTPPYPGFDFCIYPPLDNTYYPSVEPPLSRAITYTQRRSSVSDVPLSERKSRFHLLARRDSLPARPSSRRSHSIPASARTSSTPVPVSPPQRSHSPTFYPSSLPPTPIQSHTYTAPSAASSYQPRIAATRAGRVETPPLTGNDLAVLVNNASGPLDDHNSLKVMLGSYGLSDPGLAQSALQKFCILAQQLDYSTPCWEDGFLPRIVGILKKHQHDCNVAGLSIEAIYRLSSRSTVVQEQLQHDDPLVALLFDTLELHKTNPVVAERGCLVFTAFAFMNYQNNPHPKTYRERMSRLLPLLKTVMRVNISSPVVLTAACKLLKHVVYNNYTYQLAVCGGSDETREDPEGEYYDFMPLLRRILEMHSQSDGVVESGCSCVAALAKKNKETQAIIALFNSFLSVLRKVLHEHMDDGLIIPSCLEAVLELVTENNDNRRLLALQAAGYVAYLKNIIEKHPNNPAIIEKANLVMACAKQYTS